MGDFTKAQVSAILERIGYDVPEPDLTEVVHRLNALVDGLTQLDDLDLSSVEPWPLPPRRGGAHG
jgi:hypothetical protein